MTHPQSAPDRSSVPVQHGYAPVNGLSMYYEIHGQGGERPLVLLHGALSTIETSFGKLLPALSQTRQVIAIELQAHGHTADIDRPLTFAQMADDTVELLRHLGIEQADLFGYSMGAGVGLELAIRYPERVRKLVAASAGYSLDAMHPNLMEGFEDMKPEDTLGSVWEVAYTRVAPKPEDWLRLVTKILKMDTSFVGWPAESVRKISAPTLLIVGDSDMVRPEHAVEFFRLLGGGVNGDATGLPKSQFAILPGTTHVGLVDQADMLLAMIPAFLDRKL